jgi:DNA-binding NarL/FixJ family response regulator
MQDMIRIAMADDHILFRKGLATLIETLGDYKVVIQAANGAELLQKLDSKDLPELVLLDVSMPVMNGYETALQLKQQFPQLRVLALSMMENEDSVIRMIRNGARGYVLKDAEPQQLREAINDVLQNGFHFSDLVSGNLIHKLQLNANNSQATIIESLNERERDFLKYTCTDLTYKEIAQKMYISPRTVDGYRDALFTKLDIKTRVGLALFAVKHGLVNV